MSKRKPSEPLAEADSSSPRGNELERLALRHLRFGWWALLIFLSLGIVLEFLHGFKIRFYLDDSNSVRRHMWTLAHTHGTLLALVHLAFAASIPRLNPSDRRWQHVASPCLFSATILMPSGFLLGGLIFYSGDPGLGIVLVAAGGFVLLVAVWLIARQVR